MNTKKKGAQPVSNTASQLLRPAAGFRSVFGAAPNPAQILQQAVQLHQRGDLSDAERLYRQVLRARAEDPNALNMLGVVKIQQGLAQEAASLIKRAVQAQPEFAEAHNNLGLALRKLGQLEQAVQSHERAIQLKPAYAEALNNLATALREAGRLDEALAACDRALAIKPDFAQALNSRAATLSQAGRHAAALIDVERALALAPRLATAHFNHGVILGDLGQHGLSLTAYQHCVELDPRNATAWNNLGYALQSLYRDEEALRCFAQALALEPDNVEVLINQGTSLHELRRLPEAARSLERATQLAPRNTGAWTNLGITLADAAQWDGAKLAFEQVCTLEPAHPYAQGNRFNAAIRTCDWAHVDTWRADMEAAVLAGQLAATPFQFLAASDNGPALQQCAQLHAQHELQPHPPLWTGESYQHERVRVAYLSADFHDHATGHLMAEVFEKHDRERFDVSAWSFGPVTGDAMQQRLRAAFAQFHEVQTCSDAEIARRLRAAEIDILVDLKGYTKGNRVGILAHRPAPVQVNYLGYPGTLGIPGLADWIIADAHVIPPSHESFYTEKVARLADCYQPNCLVRDMAAATPSREAMGLPPQGFVFCSFNNNYKITPAVFSVWMRLLQQVEGSVLWLLQDQAEVALRLRDAAQAQGVKPERIVFAPRVPQSEHLARHARADLFLDTLPYNAHTTASDALWTGLPLLTCSGNSFASRVGGSVLRAAGLAELVTDSLPAYEAKALQLARQPDTLAAMRRSLEEGRATTPLFDSTRYTRQLEAAFLQMRAAP
jgi:predicted O-linked N-acetylglucosamine transferase (SPINDLY family)